MKFFRFKFSRFQVITHLGALLPFAVLVWDAVTGNLTFNPIQEATLRTGKTALILLILSLACTPVNTLFGFRQALRVRRPLGLYAFFYVSVHLFIFVGLDFNFQWAFIQEALFEKRYTLAGLAAFFVLLPLAITSTKAWQRRLKRNWKRLHKFVYLAGLLAVSHYVWLVKSDIRQPLAFGVVLLFLLFLRIPRVRGIASGLRFRFPFRRPVVSQRAPSREVGAPKM